MFRSMIGRTGSVGRVVIVAMKPKAGRAADLKRLVAAHVPTLRAENLVTDRRPIIMEAQDGTVVEVFEWVSVEAIAAAHSNPVVLAMWEQYDGLCDFVPISTIAETGELFAEFAPLDPDP